jgi:hypothetical protein
MSAIALWSVVGQTRPTQKPTQEPQEEVLRITTNLVQTDAVITDKSDQLIKDLKLEDFELYDNGKKQEIKFLEFVGVNSDKRVEGEAPPPPKNVNIEVPSAVYPLPI